MSRLEHFSLTVTRLEGLQRKSERPDLYFKVTIGNRDVSGAITESDPSGGANTVTFSSSDTSTHLNIRIKESSRKSIGFATITIKELLEKCASGEARLDLTHKPLACIVGTIHLRLKAIDVMTRVDIDVKSANRNIERIKRSADVADVKVNTVVASIVQKLDEIVKAIDDITSKTHPYLNLVWQATSALYKVVSHQFKDDKKLVDLVHIMEETFDFAQDTTNLKESAERLQHLTGELLNEAIECSRFVLEHAERSFAGRAVDAGSGRKMDDFKERFTDLKRRMDSAIGLHTASLAGDIHWQQRLDWLRKQLNPTMSDTSRRPRCLPETRTKYIEQIRDWLSSMSDQNILWLKGIAGSGKSTIAASIRDYCSDEKRLAAYLFFERGKEEYRSIIPSIAYQFATFNSLLVKRITKAVEQNKDFHGDLPARQFEKLLLEPLDSVLDITKQPVIIILDALDECGTVEQRREILNLLKTEFARLPMEFRYLVTIELDHTSEDSRRDVDVYIVKQLGEIVPDGEIWDGMMKSLCGAADGLFIWASTAIKMIRSSDDPIDKLQELVRDVRSVGTFGIDDLYATVLWHSGISWHDAKSKDRFTRVLGLIMFAKESLTSEAVDDILGFEPRKSRLTLQRLQSVIFYEGGKPIRLHHASFGDYLISPKRSGDKFWHIDEHDSKQAMINCCFDTMDDLLRFNICNIESSFLRNDRVAELEKRVEENIPLRLSYVCRFWVEHLCDIPYSPDNPDSLNGLRRFAFNHLLYWFEVLNLTGNFKRVVSRSLYNAFRWTPPKDEATSSFLWAAYRLASVFALPMSQSLPHIYLSALSLWKDESVVSRQYSSTHPTARVHLRGIKPPEQCIKILGGHADGVSSVAISANGRYIASGSDDETVRIWDAESGEVIQGPFEGHKGGASSVAFSPDGKRVASGSWDGSVRVWNTESRKLVWREKGSKGDTRCISSVVFSPNGRRIASGSVDGSIRVWSSKNGRLVLDPLEGYITSVYSLAFSPNGKRIISGWGSGSTNPSIRVWNAKSGALIPGPFVGHKSYVLSVAVSPDGKHVASGSDDCTVRIWDMNSGRPVLGPLEGHTESVASVAFSSDGKHIVSGSNDKDIRIWNTESGHLISGPFKGHTEAVSSVAFFPDGKRVVSGARDHTIRIWDIQSSVVSSGTFEGHRDTVLSVAFSPDGERIASGSADSTVCVWHLKSGSLVSHASYGHSDQVYSVAFSPDGKFVVSGSGDRSIRIWNAESGEVILGPLKGHTSAVMSVTFSPEGKSVVSGSRDKTIRVWDANSGETILGPLEVHKYHKHWVTVVAFSPDGTRILSGSNDDTVRIWDTERGYLVGGPLYGRPEGCPNSIAFSPDGQQFASGFSDNIAAIWSRGSDLIPWSLCRTFEHTASVRSVAFSPDGNYIVSACDDRSVRVWDVESDQVVLGPFTGHTRGVRSVAFSACGRYLVSGSDDRTIRIWNVDNGQSVVDIHGNPPSLPSGRDTVAACINGAGGSSGSQRGGMMSTLPKECKVSNWKVSEDGWIRGDQGESLIWIPEDMRTTLWHPCNIDILNCQFATGIDFESSPVGENWCKGYPRPRNDIEISPSGNEKIEEQHQDVASDSPPEISRDDSDETPPVNNEGVVQNQEVASDFLSLIILILQCLPYLCYEVVCSFIRFVRGLSHPYSTS